MTSYRVGGLCGTGRVMSVSKYGDVGGTLLFQLLQDRVEYDPEAAVLGRIHRSGQCWRQ